MICRYDVGWMLLAGIVVVWAWTAYKIWRDGSRTRRR